MTTLMIQCHLQVHFNHGHISFVYLQTILSLPPHLNDAKAQINFRFHYQHQGKKSELSC